MAEEKTNVMRILDKQKIAYRHSSYAAEEPFDGVTAANKLGLPVEQVFKTLVTEAKSGTHYVFVIPVAEELDLKKAARAVHEKAIQMIPVKTLLGLTGYLRGGCSPIGMKKQFHTVLDETAILFDTIFVSGGRRGVQIEVNPDDLCALIGAEYAELTKE
ncbi:MAG: Cys-tRNA(Pro) deacylase [Butyricicoccaceae bacterium]